MPSDSLFSEAAFAPEKDPRNGFYLPRIEAEWRKSSFNVEVENLERLLEIANARKVTVSHVVREAISEYLNKK